MLQKLVEVAVDLCDAHTAGISLLEGDVFRWEAVAGVFAAARGGTMPRDQSPCGVCIDRDATQLMHLADRCFPALLGGHRDSSRRSSFRFTSNGKPIGTVWVVSHTEDRKFDQEDERIVRELSSFASAGWQLLQTSEALARTQPSEGRFHRHARTRAPESARRDRRGDVSASTAPAPDQSARVPLTSSRGSHST